MACVDENYRPWMSEAARSIVKQMNDGTLQRCVDLGERINGKLPAEEVMARQIVGIMLGHQAGL